MKFTIIKFTFLILINALSFITKGQKQVTHTGMVSVINFFEFQDKSYLVNLVSSSHYSPLDGSFVPYSFELLYLNSSMEITSRVQLEDYLPDYYELWVGKIISADENEVVFTGTANKQGVYLRFIAKYLHNSDEVSILNEYRLHGGDWFYVRDNYGKVNDTTYIAYDQTEKDTVLIHTLHKNGDINTFSQYIQDSQWYSTVLLLSELKSDSLFYFKDANFRIITVDTLSKNVELSKSTKMASNPVGHLMKVNDEYYGFGSHLGCDDNGYIEPDWNSGGNRPKDLFMFKYNEEFELVDKYEFTDKEWKQDVKTFGLRTQPYLFHNNHFYVSVTGFAKADVPKMVSIVNTGEQDLNSKLSFSKIDTAGNVIYKQEYFENDGKNHFTWFTHKNENGFLLVNTVLDTKTFPDTVTNLELMQLDVDGEILSVKSIENIGYNEISVYPNPAKDYIQFEFPIQNTDQSYTYQVLSNDGKVVSSGQQIVERIELQDLPKGNFHLSIKQNNGQKFTSRFVVE